MAAKSPIMADEPPLISGKPLWRKIVTEPSVPTFDVPNESGIYGTTDLSIRINGLKDTAKIMQQALSNKDTVRRIRGIDIDVTNDPLEPEDEEQTSTQDITNTTEQMSINSADADATSGAGSEKSSGSNASATKPAKTSHEALFDKNYIDDEMNAHCEPIIQLLNATSSSGGCLEAFSWESKVGWWDSHGTRPREFWEALWAHSRTLKTLLLGYYTHEVHRVRPAHVAFPALRELRINASTAHGDDGDAIEHLFKSAPNLEVLVFEYPGCDLKTCQIQNITWDYSYPKLHTLEVNGYNFAPAAFKAFLGRCPNVVNLTDKLDYDGDEDKVPSLPKEALPKLRKLTKAWASERTWREYFDPEAKRPIIFLTVIETGKSSNYEDIANEHSAKTLEALSFKGNVTDYRVRVPEPDSSDEEEPQETEEQKLGMTCQAQGIKKLLAKLPDLRKLAITMESSNVSLQLPDGSWGSPPPMNVDDLKMILSLLPENSRLKGLFLEDSAAEDVTLQNIQDVWESLPTTLQVLRWTGKKDTEWGDWRRGQGIRESIGELNKLKQPET